MIAPSMEIFISYSLSDKIFVEQLVADLAQHQVVAWVGHMNLQGGQFWPDAVEKAIDRADVVLVIWSPKARDSIYVQKEYAYAVAQKKHIVPLLIKPCPAALLLQGLHWLDFTNSHIYSERLAKLVELLTHRDAIQLPSTPAPLPAAVPVSPRPLAFLPLAVIATIAIASVVLFASLHGAHGKITHTLPTINTSLTITPTVTNKASSPVATATGMVGAGGASSGSNSTPSQHRPDPTTPPQPVATSAVAPTATPIMAPTATPPPTLMPTATPTPRIGQ